jgi:hypothetical protein
MSGPEDFVEWQCKETRLACYISILHSASTGYQQEEGDVKECYGAGLHQTLFEPLYRNSVRHEQTHSFS